MEDNGYPEGRAVKLESAIPTTDSEITDVLKRSIALENGKRKVVRISYKTEFENMQMKAMAYRVWSVCGWSLFALSVIIQIVIRVFS